MYLGAICHTRVNSLSMPTVKDAGCALYRVARGGNNIFLGFVARYNFKKATTASIKTLFSIP